jgi:hypothetical protein
MLQVISAALAILSGITAIIGAIYGSTTAMGFAALGIFIAAILQRKA